ncbi:putative receptor-like protein kinase At4g00960 [Camellia sinensis]|uniref:putative receptor-like protein kinase At4g00960 n=1 Tax=Camellia sinensis TaxID=4442 RepID=UPI0010364D65|nr:putative receptor-like protein kinase At4g00960 [Camellia sinensis]
MWDLTNSLLLPTGVCNTSSTIDTVVNSFFSSGGLLLNKARDWLFHDRSSNGQDLWDRANELYKEGRVSEFVDRKLIPLVVLDQVQLCIHIGIMCTEYDLELRPTMGCVYSMLSKNHSSSSTLVEEPMRDGSSSASSTARNSGESNCHIYSV